MSHQNRTNGQQQEEGCSVQECQRAGCAPFRWSGIALVSIFCLQCHKMSIVGRLAVMWVWMLVSLAVISSALGIILYGPYTFTSVSYDMRVIKKLSNFFCQGVSIKSSGHFNAYVLKNKPSISSNKQNYAIPVDSCFKFQNESYKSWEFYFLQHSSANVSICRTDVTKDPKDDLDFYFVKGARNFNKWVSNPTCNDCVKYHHSFKPTPCFSYQAKIAETDRYYFLLKPNRLQSHYDTSNTPCVNGTFYIGRTRYITKGHHPACRNSTACAIQNWTMGSVVVYDCSDNSMATFITTSGCVADINMYLNIFLTAPILSAIILTLCLLVACRSESNNLQSAPEPETTHMSPGGATESSPLVSNPAPTYDTVVASSGRGSLNNYDTENTHRKDVIV